LSISFFVQNIYFKIILLSASACYFSIPLVRRLAQLFDLKDIPDIRKQHKVPIARIGGLSIIFGYLIPLILIIKNNILGLDFSYNSNLLTLVITSSLAFCLLGFADDMVSLSPFFRLVCQVLISLFVVYRGFSISGLAIHPGLVNYTYNIFGTVGIILTILWIVGLTNAINWTDGMDGLLSGISIIYLSCFLLICITKSYYTPAILSSSLLGSCIGFLPHNHYKAKIIMGDGGSYFVGFNLAIISILSSSTVEFGIYKSNIIYFLLPIIIFLIPIFDMIFVIISRLISSNSPFYPDRAHLHHRIFDSGTSYKKTVYLIYFLNLAFSFFALLLYKF
tara:strand:+ start:21368 stop:22372 length:1005 start_codon:yes stop_codon:yes gene_type:complete